MPLARDGTAELPEFSRCSFDTQQLVLFPSKNRLSVGAVAASCGLSRFRTGNTDEGKDINESFHEVAIRFFRE